MTLRITLEIVPHGIEADKRTIYQFDISNMGTKTKAGKTRYRMDQLIPEIPPWDGPHLLQHHRAMGAIGLVRRAMQRIEPSLGHYEAQ